MEKVLDRHIRIINDDWEFIQKLKKEKFAYNNVSEIIHLLIVNYKNKEVVNNHQILENENKIFRKIGHMSMDISMIIHMLGEMYYIKGLEYVRHGVAPTVKRTAMQLVDRDIRKAQERHAEFNIEKKVEENNG